MTHVQVYSNPHHESYCQTKKKLTDKAEGEAPSEVLQKNGTNTAADQCAHVAAGALKAEGKGAIFERHARCHHAAHAGIVEPLKQSLHHTRSHK